MIHEDVMDAVVKALESEPDQSLAHRLDHFIRVKNNAMRIAKHHDCNKEILYLACLLHDIDQPFYNKKEHVNKSLIKAGEILTRLNYAHKDDVLKIIGEHSTENIKNKSSLESKILFDADKIDGLGCIGIARVFLFMGQQGMTLEDSINWYVNKIEIAIRSLQTKEGKEIANDKLKYTKNFLNELHAEIKESEKYAVRQGHKKCIENGEYRRQKNAGKPKPISS